MCPSLQRDGRKTIRFQLDIFQSRLYLLNWLRLVSLPSSLPRLKRLHVFHLQKATQTIDTSFHLPTSFCQSPQREKYQILTAVEEETYPHSKKSSASAGPSRRYHHIVIYCFNQSEIIIWHKTFHKHHIMYILGVGDTAKFGFDPMPSNTGSESPILIPICTFM